MPLSPQSSLNLREESRLPHPVWQTKPMSHSDESESSRQYFYLHKPLPIAGGYRAMMASVLLSKCHLCVKHPQ